MGTFSLQQIASILKCSLLTTGQATGVAVDSRLIKPQELFFALPGARADGHAFIKEAAEKGAIGAIVSKSYNGPDYGLPLMKAENPLVSLQTLAKTILAQRNQKIVAVTGSIGKTTTKDFITAMLKTEYKVGSTPGNSNSQIGVPLAILNHTDGSEEILVIEMGMTLPGQIANLVEIAPPDVALITYVALVHACNFEGLEDIGKAKAEIFSHPRTRLGILPRETDHFGDLSRIGSCAKLSFSVNPAASADFVMTCNQDSLIIRTKNETVTLPLLQVPGQHNLHNLLGAITVARSCDVSWHNIEKAIKTLELPERRLQRVEKDGIVFINDSYNAAAPSLKAALQSLPQPPVGGKKIAVIGEMLELGKFSHQCHKEVGDFALQHVHSVFCLGEGCAPIVEKWKAAKRPIYWTNEIEDLKKALKQEVKAGDVVLLKGSRAKGLWKIIEDWS